MTEKITHLAYSAERANYQNYGLVLGPLFFVLMMLSADTQTTMSPVAWNTAGVALWMATWWSTEAVPVPITAFLPIVTFEMLDIASLKEAAAPYSNPIIYLFLGAFILALAVERWNLHKRIALLILEKTGTDGRKLILGFMVVAALLSMWMTNTSTTMMLMPIALSVATVIIENTPQLSDKQKAQFQIAILLGLAYAATIGGLATLVGTPPNALLAAFLVDNYGIEVSFARWMLVGVPVMVVMLPICWWALTRVLYRVAIPANDKVNAHIKSLKAELGPMSAPEKRVAIVFSLVVVLWMLRRPLTSYFNIEGLSDAGIVMAAAMVLFILPSGSQSQAQLMTWHDVNRLPWGVLVLFGGGLSLASAFSSSGLALWLGESISPIALWSVVILIIAATGLVIFLTEITSNLATTATFLPVMGAIAVQGDINPLLLCVPITLAASCAFMLPVATPPNAIVFSSGKLSIPQMVRAGVMLNIIGLLLITVIAVWWAPLILL
ncbi:DASS family sodium-coupled anion symporter [Thalassotalea ponticola]|uniref:SLC13 family permease n=1 Tax=Thalassotalea ponticola TaxID=1523392 RepID=UPI0025B5C588|nr:DASS family sodium-coupled anion symporter [Thalassotalea ponticola]MDN3653928.1 DASS family sodium-coupled anion symporter [Thalassotalea ponticola]